MRGDSATRAAGKPTFDLPRDAQLVASIDQDLHAADDVVVDHLAILVQDSRIEGVAVDDAHLLEEG